MKLDPHPLVVDLGFGRNGSTTIEMVDRLVRAGIDARAVGIEIDRERVREATGQLAGLDAGLAERIRFAHGGFEVPLARGESPVALRAFNVLRQYSEAEVAEAWRMMSASVRPGGVVIEGTCDEIGRVSSWIDLVDGEPSRLTISLRLASIDSPAIVAERLPKALIHRNVPGERTHEWLGALDRAWLQAAALSPFGARQRWMHAIRSLATDGWPILDGPARWRLGEVGVPWSAVAPLDS